MIILGAQIERFGCNAQANQQWDMTRDPSTGAIQFVSTFFPRCWSNGDAVLGGPLTLLNCSLGSPYIKSFYLEFQDLVPGCGGAANQKVRTSSAAAWKAIQDE
jgi:hypothetical protein